MHTKKVKVNYYIFTTPGILKFLTIILGTCAYGLGVYSYDETILQEEYFLRSVQFCLIVSLIYYIVYLALSGNDQFNDSNINKAFDIGYHVSGSVVLAICGGLIIYSAVDNERTYCQILYVKFPLHFCQFYGGKLAAGIVTIVNSAFYLAVAPSIFFFSVGGIENANTKQKLMQKQTMSNTKGKTRTKHTENSHSVDTDSPKTKLPHYFFNSSHI